MERLTGRNEHGGIISLITNVNAEVERVRLLHKLAAYEASGLTPEQCAELAREKQPVFMIDNEEPTNEGWMIWRTAHTRCWLEDKDFLKALEDGMVKFYDRQPKEQTK